MPAKSSTFHQLARREQLVDCALEIIGERGLAAASVSAIAQRAGVSRGVVAYNVGDREELIDHLVARAYERGRSAVGPAVQAAPDPAAALRAFVTASLAFYADYPHEMRALREIFAERAHRREDTGEHAREVDEVGEVLRAGQAQGQFVAFDIPLVVTALRAVLDVAAAQIAAGASGPETAPEVVALVERMVGA